MGTVTSTSTLAPGASRTFNLAPASAVSLTLLPNCRVTVTETPAVVASSPVGGNAPRVHNLRYAGVVTYGPYAMGGTIVVSNDGNSGSTLTWTRTDALIAEDVNGASFVVSGEGNLMALAELAVPVTLTATGTAKSGGCEFGGFVVRAVSGTVNVTIYDATSATGTPIMTSNAVALGAYPWNSGRWRENTTGCHVVIGGGGTVTLDVLAQ